MLCRRHPRRRPGSDARRADRSRACHHPSRSTCPTSTRRRRWRTRRSSAWARPCAGELRGRDAGRTADRRDAGDVRPDVRGQRARADGDDAGRRGAHGRARRRRHREHRVGERVQERVARGSRTTRRRRRSSRSRRRPRTSGGTSTSARTASRPARRSRRRRRSRSPPTRTRLACSASTSAGSRSSERVRRGTRRWPCCSSRRMTRRGSAARP